MQMKEIRKKDMTKMNDIVKSVTNEELRSKSKCGADIEHKKN